MSLYFYEANAWAHGNLLKKKATYIIHLIKRKEIQYIIYICSVILSVLALLTLIGTAIDILYPYMPSPPVDQEDGPLLDDVTVIEEPQKRK